MVSLSILITSKTFDLSSSVSDSYFFFRLLLPELLRLLYSDSHLDLSISHLADIFSIYYFSLIFSSSSSVSLFLLTWDSLIFIALSCAFSFSRSIIFQSLLSLPPLALSLAFSFSKSVIRQSLQSLAPFALLYYTSLSCLLRFFISSERSID